MPKSIHSHSCACAGSPLRSHDWLMVQSIRDAALIIHHVGGCRIPLHNWFRLTRSVFPAEVMTTPRPEVPTKPRLTSCTN